MPRVSTYSYYTKPYLLLSQLSRRNDDLVKELIHEFNTLMTVYEIDSRDKSDLQLENQRLKHENEFMLKLINMKDSNGSET